MARGTEQDLSEKLAETLMWIDLRTTLSAALRARADDGDVEAVRLLNVMAQFWPHQVPHQHELALKDQLVRNVSDLLVRALETLRGQGLEVRGMVAEALNYGMQVPEHLLEES